jgi:hypothetical protein
MDLAGGKTSWEVTKEDDDNYAAVHRFVWREYAEHAMGSVSCAIGQLDDNYYQLVLSPEGINTTTGEVTGEALLRITFSKEGEYIRECQKETITVEGDRTITISGTHEESCKEYSQTVDGEREISFKTEKKSGNKSTEDVTIKDISAQTIKLGGSTYSAVLGEALINWLLTHTHTFVGTGTVGTPQVPPTSSLLSKKVKLG